MGITTVLLYSREEPFQDGGVIARARCEHNHSISEVTRDGTQQYIYAGTIQLVVQTISHRYSSTVLGSVMPQIDVALDFIAAPFFGQPHSA